MVLQYPSRFRSHNYPTQLINEYEEYVLCNRAKRYVLSKDQLRKYGYPYKSPDDLNKIICNASLWEKKPNSNERICSRCSSSYSIVDQEDGQSLPELGCVHHKYRCQNMGTKNTVERLYPCCGKKEGALGCTWSIYHVSNFYLLDNASFVSTKQNTNRNENNRIYGLDCEMCYTVNGLEVVRVSVISYNGIPVYEAYVVPEAPIIDYNTRFSGITSRSLKDTKVKLPEVQKELLQIFDCDTILVGHALENDLKALKIIHEKVIDTSVLFRHPRGWPYRSSLKHLANKYLCHPVQKNDLGHDSMEDASTCLKLLYHHIIRDF